jgi:hypothetical protein
LQRTRSPVKYREQFGETPSDTLRRSEVAQSSR